MKILIITVSFFIVVCSVEGQDSLTIRNDVPRLDASGEIVDAHDGRVIKFGDRYYWYGTAYENTNGFLPSNHYRCYSSNDLNSWEYEGRVLPDQPEGVYYRPHVIYNQITGKYILWYNWYPKLWEGQFGVAVSDTPTGPFEIVNDDVEMFNSKYGLGDFGLFVDNDGTGYISYNTIQDHMVSIEKLSADYLSSTLENGGIIAKNVEAGSQFKRDGKYYLLTDYTCCFCNYGSGARVYISEDPLRGYVNTGNINRYPGEVAHEVIDQIKRGNRYTKLEKKENGVQFIDFNLKEKSSIGKFEIYLFTGNRKGKCGDVANPRVHPRIVTPSFSVLAWSYDEWIPVQTEIESIETSALREKVTLSVITEGRRFRVVPDLATTPLPAIHINEIVATQENGYVIQIDNAYKAGPGIQNPPIIPAQQTYVMELESKEGTQYIWMGDLWGSASDNIKGHDYQYWSAPLKFREDGTIENLAWKNEWSVKVR